MTSSAAAGPARRSAGRPSSLRTEYRELTRKRLLAAVREVLEKEDYTAATVDEIVGRAGTSRATFYLHFRSKAEAAAALLEQVTPSDRGWYTALEQAVGSREGLRRWMDEALHWYESHAGLLAALNEAGAVERMVAERRSESIERLVETMSGYLDRFEGAARTEAQLRLQLLVRQLHQVATDTVVQGTWRTDRELLLDVMSASWHATLGPDGSGPRA
ncbi:TetR/AcrR family transcriptional regulator [Streptacidiphilus sp. ASG 303]|uniref:TetR/AcrR family transcriptional regulator n=1 Tax=Streptacidiphilus sp. ASG 303 TaxID=2896847 RepID=UPI001E28BF32|nr:TetR/AcrR family transcriptional regulator [Streptacidiphilus sp. ASG 303]MCD0483426.1 TetR/AcrR family transcriptional regulator [Streptacidiphilus sp. ASG 303]